MIDPRYKKWLILLILAIVAYILMRLLHKRRVIGAMEKQMPTLEGLDNISSSSNRRNLRLTSYFVKSSYNSCLDNSFLTPSVSLAQLERVIQAGFRFLDFELCMSNNTVYVCANSTYVDDTNQNNSNLIPFSDVVNTIITLGLTAGKKSAPNFNEPIFIHLRQAKTTLTGEQFKTFLSKIVDQFARLYTFMPPAPAKLNEISLAGCMQSGKKCFIMLDMTKISADSTFYAAYVASDLRDKVHATTGFNTGEVPLYFYDDVNAKGKLYTVKDAAGRTIEQKPVKVAGDGSVNVKNFSIVIPSSQKSAENYYPYDYAKNFGIQMVTTNAALNDYGMTKINDIFTLNKKPTGFMSMQAVIDKSKTDLRYNMRDDIKRGIYISMGLVFAITVMFSIQGR